ncbi:unnamed protein product [Aphanomyces euteiches]
MAAIVAPSLQSSCSSIESDVDYSDPDLRSVAASAPEDCCGICANDDECKAFSHYLGVCYLKSAKGNPISKAGVHSGTLAPPPSQCSAIEIDVDYSGADLRSVAASVAEDCCAICAGDANSKAFSHYLGVCYLKSAKGNAIAKPGVRSATVSPPTSQCSPMENDIDYSGGDLVSIASDAAEDCCAICKATSGCILFSHAGGVCYLKNVVGSRVSKSGVRSALLSSAITTSVPTPTPTTPPTIPPTPAPTPKTTLPLTPRPTFACTEKRQRRSWSSLSPDDKELYLSAVEEAMRRGLFKQFDQVNRLMDLLGDGHDSCGYFFWHRKFLLAYESMLRSLDPKYACLTLAYWDFTEDYLNFEHGKCKTIAECSPVTQSWGGSTNGIGRCKDEIDVINRPMNSSNGLAVLRGRWHEFAMPNWTISTVQSALRGSSSIGNISRQIETGMDANVRGNLKGSLAVNRGNSLDPLFFLHFATIDFVHSIFYHCNVEGLNLDDQGQRTHPSSFESCSITTSNGKTTAIEPTSEILFQSAVNIYEEPFPISRNRGIGKFFTELPREYYKLADIRSLGYSYDLTSSIGKLYSTCGTA